MIALGVYQQDFMFTPLNLTANDECGFEFLAFDGSFLLLLPTQITDLLGGVFDVGQIKQVARRILLDVALDPSDGGLTGGQVAGSENDELLAAIDTEAKHLAVRRHLVYASVGEGVRAEYHAGIYRYCYTIRHILSF